MGKTQSTGNLTNALAQDSSNNIGIGGAANASFKLQVTGTTNLTSALTGTSAVFSSTVQASAYRLTGMTAGSGALYWSSDRVTLANYNASGTVVIETGGGTTALTLAANQAATFASSVTATSESTSSSLIQHWAYNTAPNQYNLKLNTIVSSGLVKYSFDLRNNNSDYPNNLVLTEGNVGIGTSTTNAKLDVKTSGNGLSYSSAYLSSDSSVYGNALLISHLDGITRIMPTYLGSGIDCNLTFWTTQSNGNQAERMRITSGGNVLMGTTSEYGSRLVTYGASSTSSDFAIRALNSNNNNLFSVRNDGLTTCSNSGGTILLCQGNSNVNVLSVDNNGNLKAQFIGTNSGTALVLDSSGFIVKSSSSIRYKKDIEPIDIGLDFINSLNPVKYNLKLNEEAQVGFIAEDFPDDRLVSFTQIDSSDKSKGLKKEGVNYANLTAVLVKAIQEQQSQIEAQQQQINSLINR